MHFLCTKRSVTLGGNNGGGLSKSKGFELIFAYICGELGLTKSLSKVQKYLS